MCDTIIVKGNNMANQRQYESMVWNHLYVLLRDNPATTKAAIEVSFVGPAPQTDAQWSRYNKAFNKVEGQLQRFAGPEEELL